MEESYVPSEAVPPKKDNTLLIVIAVIVGLFLLCCCCFAALFIFVPGVLGPSIGNVFSNIVEGLGVTPMP